jgi:hypothetical protein
MTDCGQRGQLWGVAPSAHSRYGDDVVHWFPVFRVQGGRFFVIKMGGFSMLKLIRPRTKWSTF